MANAFGDEEVSSAGRNSFGDEEVSPQGPGLVSAFKRGMDGFNTGRSAIYNSNIAQRNAELEEIERTATNEAERAAAKLERERNMKQFTGNMNEIRANASSAQVLYPKTEGYKKFEQADGWVDSAKAFLQHPIDVMTDVTGESLGGQIKALPLVAAAGVAGGPVGLGAAVLATSTATEYGGGVAEAMMELNVDINDPEAVARAMATPEFKAKQAQKMKKAVVVGTADAVTAGLAGVKLRPSVGGNLAAQTGAQMAGGGGGEALGSLAADEEIKPQAVLAEMIGEVPSAMMDVGTMSARRMLTAPALERAADQKEKEAAVGLTDAQLGLDQEVKHENKKPKLSVNQARIVTAAAQMGVDPMTALAIAGVETGGKYNFDAKNPKSSAHGVFQIIDDTWNGLGGGDRNDPALQIQRGLELIRQTNQTLYAEMGRQPEPYESYMGHLLGPQTAASVLVAPDDMSIADAIRKASPKNVQAIVQNNGMSGMTVGQVKAKWQKKINDQILATGGNPEMNMRARASVEADAAPREDFELEDLDAMFNEMEVKDLTPEDIDAALKEEGPAIPVNPEATIEAEFLNEEGAEQTESIVGEQETLPSLPADLQGASPRYGFGTELFTLEFSNDVDKAAYIVANGAKKSPRDADFLQFVMEAKGLNETEARLYGSQVRREIKELASAARGTGQPSLRHGSDAGVSDETARLRADSFVSIDAVKTRDRYDNPNDAYRNKAGQLPIVAAGDWNALGMKLGERALQPGEVVAAGVESTHTPLPYMMQMQELFQNALSQFAPNARLVLTFATEAKDAISSYAEMKGIGVRNKAAKGRGLYKINMRNATNLGITSDGTNNYTTQVQIVAAAWHEFGHVVADEQMTKGMSPTLKQKFQNLEVNDYFTEEELAELSPEQATVLREYNELKWKTLNDPNFTAEDFGYAWLSPWKLAHGIGTKGIRTGLESFVKKYMGETEVMLLKTAAKPFAMRLNERSNILSPHEYMAEQMSRYAYSRGLYDQSNLAQNFFMKALDSMRRLFQNLKRGGEIRPGVAFADWMDSLTGLSQAIGENKALPEVAESKAQKPKVKLKPAAARKANTLIVEDKSIADSEPLMPPDKLQGEQAKTLAVAEYTDSQLKNLQLLATDLRYLQKTRPAKYQHYMDLVRSNQLEQFYEEAQMELPDEIADKIRFDTDVPSEQQQPWAEVELALPKAVKDKNFLRGVKVGTWSIRRLGNFVTNMRQMAFANPEVAGLQHIDLLMGNYKAFKSKLEFKGLEVTDRWSKLAKEQHGLLEQAMREEHTSDENWATLQVVNGVQRFVANERLQQYAQQKGLDPQTVEVWLAAKNAHISHMNALQNVLKQKMAERFKGKPKTLQVKLHELGQLFDVIRNSPFLPQTRFGEFAVHVKENTPNGEKIVHVEFFETQAQRDEGLQQLKKVAGNRKVAPAMYSPGSAILRTLPPQILSTYAQELELTELQRKELRQIADAITKNPQLRRYSQQLSGVTGANKDLHRNFADFMWHSSNNIAKLHYRQHFRKGLFSIMADMHQAAEEGDLAYYDKLASILKFSRDYVDHMMNPTDEWQKVRAFVVIKQLWGNIKTAVANVTSLTNLWALAATQQGVTKGTVAVSGTVLKSLNASINSAYNRVLRGSVEGAQVWAPDTKWALDQAKSDGLLDESFAAQLATFAQSSTLSRMNFDRGDSFMKKAIWYGMLPQHATETFVRRTTLVHQFESYMKKGMGRKEAYMKARGDTYRTQGDNSMMNRPAFMRGKAASFLIYYGFIQNQIYLLSGAQERARNYREALADPKLTANMTRDQARKKFYRIDKTGGETVKLWMAYTMLGGMMGVPGAENLDDILELVAKKMFGTRFSLKEQAFKLANHISQNARSIGLDVNPRSLVHGMGADLDLFWFGPKVDMSSSLSMGNLLPGGNALGELGGNKEKFLLGAMGPLGNVVGQALDVFGDDPSMLKKMAFFLPNTAVNVGKTFNEWDKGVRAPSGGKITIDRETGELRDLTTGENLIRLMGFNPEIISGNKEIHWMQKEAQMYWTNRRNRLIAQTFEARLQGDREAMADADEELKSFNEKAPGKIRITNQDLRKAMKRKEALRKKDERGISRQKRFQALDDEIAEDVRGSSLD